MPMRRLLLSSALPWPGNIRQLEAVMRRAHSRALLADPEFRVIDLPHIRPVDLEVEALPPDPAADADTHAGTDEVGVGAGGRWRPVEVDYEAPARSHAELVRERERLDALERALIEKMLSRTGGVVSRAARLLGVKRTSLLSRMKTLGVEWERP